MSIVLQCWGLEPLTKCPMIKYNASLHISSNLSHYNEVCILIYIVAVLVASKWGVSRREWGGCALLRLVNWLFSGGIIATEEERVAKIWLMMGICTWGRRLGVRNGNNNKMPSNINDINKATAISLQTGIKREWNVLLSDWMVRGVEKILRLSCESSSDNYISNIISVCSDYACQVFDVLYIGFHVGCLSTTYTATAVLVDGWGMSFN